MPQEVLRVENLKVYYYTIRGVVKAVDNVSLTLNRGETLGIAGESGCGKSTLAWSLLRLVPPPGRIVDGRIVIDGIDITKLSHEELRKVRWRKVSMIFQGAMNALNPVMPIWLQIAEPFIYHLGMSKEEAHARAVELLRMVGLDESFAKRYPHELSGGQKQRVVIAMAIALKPDVLIADEPTTALDVVVQAQILNLLKKLVRETGVSLIIISHDLSVIAELADKVAIMYGGKIVEYGPSEKIYKNPKHPYTQALLKAIPRLRAPRMKLSYIPGQPPDLRTPPPGCRFAPRCNQAMPICSKQEPPLIEVDKGQFVACWLYSTSEKLKNNE